MNQRALPHGSIEQSTPLIEIATRNVVHLAPGDSVGMAARIMAEKRISSLVVTDEAGGPVGIVTERDMLHAMQSGRRPETAIREIMSAPVITVPENITCLDAYQICLRDGIRHLVIVDDERLLFGVVSETDFRLHISLAALAGHRQVAAVMSRSVFSLPPQASLQDALDLMQSHRDSCVVVVEAERPVGIITERDIVRLYSSDSQRIDIPVRGVMTSPVLTITLDNTINEAAERMLKSRVRHLVAVDQAGRVAGLLGEHDLTQAMTLGLIDEKRVEEGVFLHTLINTIPDLVWLKDADGVYLACNPRFESFFGAREKDIVGKTDYDFVGKEQAGFFRAHDRIAMEKDGPSVNEEWCAFADGHRELLETIKAPMRDSQGKLVGVLGVARDITAHKQAEEMLRKQKQFSDDVINSLPGIFYVLDQQGCFLRVNPQFVEVSGYSSAELEGMSALSFFAGMDREIIEERIRKVFETGSAWAEAEFITKSGNKLPYYFSGHRTDIDGQPYIVGLGTDITERKRAEDALREREELFSAIVNQAADSIVLVDSETLGIAEFNAVAHESLGYTRDEFAALTVADIQAELSAEQIRQRMKRSLDRNETLLFETRHRRKDGSIRETQVSSRPVIIRGKRYVSAIWSDITRRKRNEEALRITASVFDNSQEAILITDADNVITDVNPAFTHITGFSREEVLGRNPKILSSGHHDQAFYAAMWQSLEQEKAFRGEIWNRRKSGEIYAEMLSISAICGSNGKVERYVGVFSDISRLKEHEAELSRVAHYDALTGIPNRVLLGDRLKQAIAQTSREQNMVAVCYLDLDGFKPINDTFGHEAGDQVLVEVAKRLGGTIRGGDTVARLGGDEFVVLLQGLERGEECMTTLERLLAVIEQPLVIKNQVQTLSASIGVSIYPLDDVEPDTLLRHADQAMYVAKQSGKSRFYIYDAALDQRARNRHEYLQSVRDGLEKRQFELYYQPKVNLGTGQLVGVEALIRWRHPERGLLAPVEFLRSIENTELDIEVGDWVVAAALEQMSLWQQAGLDIEVSINISAYHLESARFAEKLQQQLAAHPHISAGRVQIEVLETVAFNELVIVREVVETCRKFGVRFALDDFGTGYSSLSYLSSLPIDVLKIDQSFVRDMLEDKGDRAIVHGIIALAQAFERHTVAEGIETPAHHRALLEMGCEVGQGYGIAYPMPADELASWQSSRLRGEP